MPVIHGYNNSYSPKLLESKNIIFRGAPGTGKSYLAKQIDTDIVSNGEVEDYMNLSNEEKEQIEFVQFHPSYDYSDFVEGLRPKLNSDGTMGFELQAGIFKRFVEKAITNYENSQKSIEEIEKENIANSMITNFLTKIEFEIDKFKTIRGSEFTITDVNEKNIEISIPENNISNKLYISIDEIKKMIESEEEFEKVKDIAYFFDKK